MSHDGDEGLPGAELARLMPDACPLHQLNVLSCGVVGSYTVVLAINSYSFTSLSHVTLNILKRALRPDFRRAFTKVPWQTTGKGHFS